MDQNAAEIVRREAAARAAIARSFGKEEGEFGANQFVSHHLDEMEGSYWREHLGTASPDPARVLSILVLRSHWSSEDDDGIDVFDFTLPGDVSDYVLSVSFDEAGQIEEMSMES